MTYQVEDWGRDVTCQETLKLMAGAVARFRRRVPQAGWDDAQADAALGWAKAFATYDPGCGASFETWAWTKMTGAMLDGFEAGLRHETRLVFGEELDGFPAKEPAAFDRAELVRGMSADAKVLVDLILEAPVDLQLVLGRLGTDGPGAWRHAAREVLADLGWSRQRVKRAFREVRSKL